MVSLETITVLVSAVGAVGAVVAAIVGFMNQRSINRSLQPLFELNRMINLPTGSSMQTIEVSHPDKTTERCSVFYNGKPLVCLNNMDPRQFERTILVMGSAQFRLPEIVTGALDENALVVVKDGKRG